MLRNLGLDLDLSKVGKDLKLQLALPNKTIKKNISDVTQANLEGFEINGLPKLTFEIPHKIQERVGKTDEIRIVDNPDIKMIKEKMLIKVTWYNKKRINWFRINSITQTDSQDFVTMRVEADALQSELRATNISIDAEPVDAVDYFTHVLSQTMWQLGTVSEKIKGTYRSFDDSKRTRYEAVNNGLETFGAVADWDEENRVLNILSISDIREFRGVVLKKENYVSSLEIESNSEDIVTRLYVYGNEGKSIENVNPTGMSYIEDFSYFIYPFERDLAKNVITHSDYMSDELCHAILDLKLLQDEYNPRIKDLQTNLNNAYGDLSRNNLTLVELQGQLVTTQALLDTAKATNDSSLITQRELEVQTKETEIANKVEEIDAIQSSIDLWENTIVSYQELISTTSFTQALQNELSLFIYEKEFSDDRYIEEAELLEAGQEQFDKYQRPTRSFTIQLASFVNSIESQYIGGRLQIGEEVLIKSTKLKTEYKSIVLGYNVDFKTGDYQLIISDNMEDIDSMDKLATLIYKADSSSTILNNNKYKWDSVAILKDEVEAWRDKEIKTVENRIIAGANESVVIDNRGIQAHNPDFPDERIIIQSGVMALSRDGGKTWSTSVTPYGVMAETIIGKIIAGNNLVITNDSGSFVIDNSGLTINMDDIHIMSGQSGTPEDMIQMWNNLLLTYDEIASDNLVNEYEKNQLEKQWTKIVNIHSSMVEQFLRGWEKLEDEGIPKPLEYNEYITAYENLNTYLNTTKQSDGFALLDVANRTSTSSINPLTFSQKFKEYEMKKASFESVIAMEFTNGAINVLEEGISLTYTKNSEILTQLNLSEEGVRIDGKLLKIDSQTEFNADLVMNAGVIKDKDNGIIIDLNAGEITLNKPITISAGSNLATKDKVAESILADKMIKDTRNDNQPPSWYYTNYPKQKAYELKYCATIGIPTGFYASVVTEVPWDDASGGTVEQRATTNDGVYQRRGTTTWSAWAKIADSSNIVSQINISPESILIASNKIQIKGDTYIDNGVIKTAHIADLAVSGAKIISLDASKIVANDLSAITTNTGQLNVTGWLDFSTENKGLRGSYDFGDTYGGAFDARWFDGSFRLSHRHFVFTGNNYEVNPNNTKGRHLGYSESYQGQDYLKFRTWNYDGGTMFGRVDITSTYINMSNRYDTTNINFNSTNGNGYFRGLLSVNDVTVDTSGNLQVYDVNAHSSASNIYFNSRRGDVADFRIGVDGVGKVIQSYAAYARTYSSASNMFITDSGSIGRSISARKYKLLIEDSELLDKAKNFLQIKPKNWYDKAEVESVAKALSQQEDIEPSAQAVRHHGFIADELDELDLKEVVQYGIDGQVEGLAYDRLTIYYHELIKDLYRRIEVLENGQTNSDY